MAYFWERNCREGCALAHTPQSDLNRGLEVRFSNDYLFRARVYVAWEPYREHIPVEERHDFIAAYNKRLNSTDESVQVYPCTSMSTKTLEPCHV